MIGTNCAPSDDELHDIRRLLAGLREELSLVADEVRSSGRRAPVPDIRTIELAEYIQGLEALVSPARTLFPELLSEIFIFCLSGWDIGQVSSLHADKAPLVLTQICSGWRNVAISTPQLWSKIALHLYFDDVRPTLWIRMMEKHASALQTWLERAGNLPLYVRINYTDVTHSSTRYFDDWSPAAANVVSKLVPHRFHWKDIRIEMPSYCLAPIFETQQSPSPLLESLAIMDWMWAQNRPVPRLSTFKLGETIRLRRCALTIPEFVLESLDFPWVQLRELNIGARDSSGLSLGCALRALQRCPNLKRFMFAVSNGGGRAPDSIVEASQLKRLHIRPVTTQASNFLGAVNLPRLRKLIVQNYWNEQELLSFFARGVHLLEELVFKDAYDDLRDDELIGYLQYLPSLKRLSTSRTGTAVFLALTPSDSGDGSPSCLCPHLEFLDIKHIFSVEGLSEMVELRWQGGQSDSMSQLKHVRLSFHDEAQAMVEVLNRLRKCCDEGLNLEWT